MLSKNEDERPSAADILQMDWLTVSQTIIGSVMPVGESMGTSTLTLTRTNYSEYEQLQENVTGQPDPITTTTNKQIV